MLDKDSDLWGYLSDTEQQLAADGMLLIEDRDRHPNEKLSDYSYLVFPFAKLYEGFLKRLFLDLGIITPREYNSAHFRLGKVLSPNMARRLRGRSAYQTMAHRYGAELADRLWRTWKEGRNLVFHYFPRNVRKLDMSQAMHTLQLIIDTMNDAVRITNPTPFGQK